MLTVYLLEEYSSSLVSCSWSEDWHPKLKPIAFRTPLAFWGANIVKSMHSIRTTERMQLYLSQNFSAHSSDTLSIAILKAWCIFNVQVVSKKQRCVCVVRLCVCVGVCAWGKSIYKDRARCCLTTTTSWSAMFFEVLLPIHLNQMHCQTHVQSQGPCMYIPVGGTLRTVHNNIAGTTARELPPLPVGDIWVLLTVHLMHCPVFRLVTDFRFHFFLQEDRLRVWEVNYLDRAPC